ncbi:MAG: bifunctional DNA primase/polymerase [Chloroflexi bacterium]|nr:bifunctional DNA primase/polymerase [Chloroflexota bacterium]
MLTAALAYARRGWAVLPIHSPRAGRCSCGKPDCASAGKHPRTPNGVKDATADEGTIRAWWRQWPDANVAIATGAISALMVLDVDPAHGGLASLMALVDRFGPPPASWAVATGGGGPGRRQRAPAGRAAHHAGPGKDARRTGGGHAGEAQHGATGHQGLAGRGAGPADRQRQEGSPPPPLAGHPK